jgi:VWFA-related protein
VPLLGKDNFRGAMSLRYWAIPLLCCLTCAAFAQQNDAPAAQQNQPGLAHRPAPNPETAQGKMKIDVLVTDASGHPVAGLTRQDFALLDNKQPQPILSFRPVDGSTGDGTPSEPPVEVILLIDEANNQLTNVAYERYQIDRFLRQNSGHLAQPVTLMIFTDRGVQAQPRPTTDGNAVAEAFDKVSTSMHAIPLSRGYDAIERVQLSLKTLHMIAATEAPKPGRKMLIWIGPGWPMLEGSGYQASDRSQKSAFNSIVEISQLLREARMTLYSINALDPGSAAMGRTDFYKDFLKPVRSAHEAESGDLAVPVFAVHSGGRVFNQTGDLAALIGSCVAEAKAYYTLGFNPPPAEHTDEYHAIDVTVAKPGLTARTSAGYYAEPLPKP